ncbi:hypothetical protein RUE5091_03330 [Ruegeria denitrificans]|uniref:Uncharacterized protein n=1 Tax=Ruegeria denitrificans TaxID=1715692 RepID=A0A0P1IFS4_9RHOB|nr:hypothetical protein RUE5091_03330 [Ruegeria denitrificans]
MGRKACRYLRLNPSVKLQKVIVATELPFAALAARSSTNGNKAQNADFAKFVCRRLLALGTIKICRSREADYYLKLCVPIVPGFAKNKTSLSRSKKDMSVS